MNHRPKGVSQAKCAKLAGLAQNQVSFIETGKDCKVSTLKKYLEACDKEMVIIDKRK